MSDSEDDYLPDAQAARLASQLASATTKGSPFKSKGPSSEAATPSKQGDYNTNIDVSAYELQLKQQAAVFIQQRQSEIDSYQASLTDALGEVRRIRLAEEARLQNRVQAVTEAFQQQMAAMHQDFQAQVEALESKTQAFLAQLRQESEATIARQVRHLAGSLPTSPQHLAKGPGSTASAAEGFSTPTRSKAAAEVPVAQLPQFLTPQGRPAYVAGASAEARTAGVRTKPGASPATLNSPGHAHSAGRVDSPYGGGFMGLQGGPPGTLHKREPKVLDLLVGYSDEDD